MYTDLLKKYIYSKTKVCEYPRIGKYFYTVFKKKEKVIKVMYDLKMEAVYEIVFFSPNLKNTMLKILNQISCMHTYIHTGQTANNNVRWLKKLRR